MPADGILLTDVNNGIWHESYTVEPRDGLKLSGSEKWSVAKRTLRGGLSDGVDLIELNNGRLALSILPTRGMGIWRGSCDGLALGWRSPVERPVHPNFVDANDRGGIGWLAGFNEWICRCGLDSNGPPGPDGTLHGRIANLPAHQVSAAIDTAGPGTIAVTGIVDETTMFGPNLRLSSTVETAAGSNRFTIIDEITNRRGTSAELELLYHINTGRPFLEPGARCVAPALEVAPRDPRASAGIDSRETYGAPEAGYAEQVFFYDLAADGEARTQVLLRNAHGDKGLSLHWSKKELPFFTLWKNTQAEEDGYVTGLEPSTNLPNLKSFERAQGRVITLAPGGRYTIRLEITVHSTAAGVREVEEQIAKLQSGHKPRVHREPRAEWSPL